MNREVCVGDAQEEHEHAGADRAEVLFEDKLHIYGGRSGNFMIYVYPVVGALSLLFFDCSWIHECFAHIYPLDDALTSV
jgi:hypothetical protein